jgi:RNA polymerase sigma-70 factor (ECF subfamily)
VLSDGRRADLGVARLAAEANPPAAAPLPAEIAELYARFGPTIYARCRQILRDTAAAEDATQEVFFRVHKHLAGIEGQRQTLGWLYRVATNHCLNEVRNGRTRAHLINSAPAPSAPDAERRLSERDLVARVLRHVPAELALPAWLYHVDGLEQGEIAEVCGVSRRTVIARLDRFARRARQFLGKESR